MTGELVILRGYPGSGKSTITRRMIQDAHDNGETVMVVSLDDFREILAGSKVRWHEICDTIREEGKAATMEHTVVRLAHDARARLLDLGFTVISDATHLDKRYIREEIDQAERHHAQVKIIDIGTDLDIKDLEDRNVTRSEDDRLPVDVIRRMWNTYGGTHIFNDNEIIASSGKTYCAVKLSSPHTRTDL